MSNITEQKLIGCKKNITNVSYSCPKKQMTK